MGETFAAARNRLVDEDCGRIENVRRIVREAAREGILDDEEDGD
jgi:hypothetical protein